MPGILPMKVIKVGPSSQSRIAQACDRCRSKKIRCDGIRPSCTQCITIGFECNTSDKLSRRAFPRGYTESLEERVRSLETEVRELKELLDVKEGKIDVLLRMQSRSPRTNDTTSTATTTGNASSEAPDTDNGDFFAVANLPVFVQGEESQSYVAGGSSARACIEAFKNRVKSGVDASIEERVDLLLPRDQAKRDWVTSGPVHWKPPPRLLSDRLVNIFFQEWAPLFPILHRPTFLHLYENYVASPEAVTDPTAMTQLLLVFSIAIQSMPHPDKQAMRLIEQQWRASLIAIAATDSLLSLQNLLLAQLCCLLSGDDANLVQYKALAVGLSYRMGLHRSQRNSQCSTLVRETRTKIFWVLYTLDCFSAAHLGLPRQLKAADVLCELPIDIDDDHVAEAGLLLTTPGEPTKLSSGIALFRGARILASVLEQLYLASDLHSISFKTIASLQDELDAWQSSLPKHLRLQLVQDKPSTSVITSGSAILSLTHQYISSLIHRPAVCAAGSLGDRASSSVAAVATAAKRTVQIFELLHERDLSFALCLNRHELILTSGFGLLFESLQPAEGGDLSESSHAALDAVTRLLSQDAPLDARNFHELAHFISPCSRQSCTPPLQDVQTSPEEKSPQEADTTMSSAFPDPHAAQISPLDRPASTSTLSREPSFSTQIPNLDYLSFIETPYALSTDCSPTMPPPPHHAYSFPPPSRQPDPYRLSYPLGASLGSTLAGFDSDTGSLLNATDSSKPDRMDISALGLVTTPPSHPQRQRSAPEPHDLLWGGQQQHRNSVDGSSHGGSASSPRTNRGALSPIARRGSAAIRAADSSARWRARMGSLNRTDGSGAAGPAALRCASVVASVGEEEGGEDEDMRNLDDGFGL